MGSETTFWVVWFAFAAVVAVGYVRDEEWALPVNIVWFLYSFASLIFLFDEY